VYSWSSRRHYRLSLPKIRCDAWHGTARHSAQAIPPPDHHPVRLAPHFASSEQPTHPHSTPCTLIQLTNCLMGIYFVCLQRPQRPSPLAGDGGAVRLTTGCGRNKHPSSHSGGGIESTARARCDGFHDRMVFGKEDQSARSPTAISPRSSKRRTWSSTTPSFCMP